MKAVVARGAGGPDVLQVMERSSPQPDGDHVLIRVDATSVSRADVEVRRGEAPGVIFPRITGCECAGTVSEDPAGRLRPGRRVVAFLGGLGRTHDGSYARFAAVRADRVFPVETELPASVLAALPVAYLTAAGALFDRLELNRDHTLLVRGGSSAVGLAAIALAAREGARVIATTRDPEKKQRLTAAGCDAVIVDSGQIVDAVGGLVPGGVDRVIDLVGPSCLKDSLAACAHGGALCAVGRLGGLAERVDRWALGGLLEHVRLTDFDVESQPWEGTQCRLQEVVEDVAAGGLAAGIEATIGLEDIVAAHRTIESGRTCGRIVMELVPT